MIANLAFNGLISQSFKHTSNLYNFETTDSFSSYWRPSNLNVLPYKENSGVWLIDWYCDHGTYSCVISKDGYDDLRGVLNLQITFKIPVVFTPYRHISEIYLKLNRSQKTQMLQK